MFKKISTIKLLIVLAALVGVFLIVKFTSNQGRSKSYRTELVNIDPGKVTSVEISGPDGTTTLTKKEEEKWVVSSGGLEKPAVETRVSSMLSTLNDVKPSRLASRSEDKWKDYQVDSAGTRVQAFSDGKSMVDIVLGRFGVEGQRSFYTYVRLFEDKDVYVANNFMKMSISTKAEDFRDNILLRLKKDSLQSIAFNYPDSALVIEKSGDQWITGGRNVDSAAVASYISGLGYVSTKNFTSDAVSGTPDLSVVFDFTDQPKVQLSAYKNGNDWIIQSSENDAELFTDQSIFDKVFIAATSL
ncbi:MAG: DUF4340 domain-containing protein [Cyclobacteriaceae bacterium]|nr:DUF4340 domain-containing protein [Cyclobacteriaceae bacterium HetDA_MAG_MS6]